MENARDALNPANLDMLRKVVELGGFAAAARAMGVVPSALTYRIRRMEEALNVMLFDRSGRQAQPTSATRELLREGARLLAEMDAIAYRLQRVATGWEPQLTIAIENLIDMETVLDLCESFYALGAPTRIKLREEVMRGTLETLLHGQADLAIGLELEHSWVNPQIEFRTLGTMKLIYAVAPHHPLAGRDGALTPEDLLRHRAVAVADSVCRDDGRTHGLQSGQDVLTLPHMRAKIAALARGMGAGYIPFYLARRHLQAGTLVAKQVLNPQRETELALHYAWHAGQSSPGRALQWWLYQLTTPAIQHALLNGRDAADAASLQTSAGA